MTAVLETPELTGRIGGPIGKRAAKRSPWFDPARFALPMAGLTMALCLLRQVPCRPLPGDFPNAYKRLCYSDIQSHYFARGLSTGAGVYEGAPLEYSPLFGYLVQFANWLAGLFVSQTPDTSFDEQITGSTIFVVTCAVVLSTCFIATTAAHLVMGNSSATKASDGVHVRAWDAVLIAISPVVLFAGLISWDLLAVGLTSAALLSWAKRRPALTGICFGLACAARLYPLAILLGLGLLCLRAGKVKSWLTTLCAALGVFVLVNLPVMIMNFQGWVGFWRNTLDRANADLGSFWYVLELAGIKVPALNVFVFGAMLLGWVGLAYLILHAPRRPRLGQVACLAVLVFLIFAKGYPPQFALWLVPLVVLARPKLVDVAVWTAGELIYYFAVWGFLDGGIGRGSGGEWIYWMAIGLRICAQLWIGLRIIDDINRPWEDPVRTPFVDDPIGGELDHSNDAPWAAGFAAAPALHPAEDSQPK